MKGYIIKKFLRYLVAVGLLVVLALALYTYEATKYSLDPNSFHILHVLYFSMLPVISTLVFSYLQRKDLPNVGRFAAANFVVMYAIIILYALFTGEQYRLSHNLLEQEVRGLHFMLFLIGFAFNWITGVLIGRAFKRHMKQHIAK